MKSGNIKPPRYSDSQIQKAADDFRSKYWDGKLPIDILAIIEFDLEMEVRLAKGLKEKCDVDALLMSDMQTIYVDHDQYMDPSYDARLRFSLAHEVGHLILHRDFYESLEITTQEDIYQFYNLISEEAYRWLELWHCNEFAGRLLVPPDLLVKECQETLNTFKESINLNGIDLETAVNFISPQLNCSFGVSTAVIDKRLTVERVASQVVLN